MINFRDLITRGAHFGHQTSRWNPRMAPFIWGQKNGIHIIDVSKTAQQLERAAKFLEQVAAEGKIVLFVGTKKAAQKPVEEAGKKLGMPYVNYRWVGGSITNYPQVKKSVTRLMHLEDVLAKSENFHYTKKELNTIGKMADRLTKNIGGIRTLKWPIGAVVVVDVKKETTAVREANYAQIPVVAMVDTNCDPTAISYVIPSNDDSPKAIEFVVDYLAQAVAAGKAKRAETISAAQAEQPEVDIEQVDVLVGVAGLEEEEAKGAKTPRRGVANKPTGGQRRPSGPRPAPRKS